MSHSVELARRATESAAAFFEALDEYVVCDFRAYPMVDSPEVEFGRQAVIDMSRRFWDAFEEYTIEAEEFVAAGPAVVVVMRDHGRGRGSGAVLERQWAWLWMFRNERLVRMESFPSKEAALEAVGLRE